MKAINITAYTEDAYQIEAIKAVIKAFKIPYSISKSKETEAPYNPKFLWLKFKKVESRQRRQNREDCTR